MIQYAAPLQFRCTIIGLRQFTPKLRPERACVGMGSWIHHADPIQFLLDLAGHGAA
jgi:hypothetical protein